MHPFRETHVPERFYSNKVWTEANNGHTTHSRCFCNGLLLEGQERIGNLEMETGLPAVTGTECGSESGMRSTATPKLGSGRGRLRVGPYCGQPLLAICVG